MIDKKTGQPKYQHEMKKMATITYDIEMNERKEEEDDFNIDLSNQKMVKDDMA